MRKAIVAIGFLVACGSTGVISNPDAGDAGHDAKSDAIGGGCCTFDSHPGCCMNYGGWSDTGTCGTTCDGMPQPNDPGWSLVKDSHGCSMWTNPKPPGGPGTCGAANLDSGADVQSDS